jgi:hypothetical protein
LNEQITALQNELKTSVEQLQSLMENNSHLSQQINGLKKQLHDESELRALDRIDRRGRFRGFMSDRLNPALSDARDALEFDPPDTEAARQRIEMAITAVSREMENLK